MESYATTEYVSSSSSNPEAVAELDASGVSDYVAPLRRELPPTPSEMSDDHSRDSDAAFQRERLKSNSLPLSMKEMYEDLIKASQDAISPYAVCYTPATSRRQTLERSVPLPKPTAAYEPFYKSLSGLPLRDATSGAPSKKENDPPDGILLASKPDDHHSESSSRTSQSISEDYEDMTSHPSVAPPESVYNYDDIPDMGPRVPQPVHPRPQTHGGSDERTPTQKRDMLTDSRRPFSRSFSDSGSARSSLALSSQFQPLQPADPTSLQLSMLIKMQEMLAKMQSTYGQELTHGAARELDSAPTLPQPKEPCPPLQRYLPDNKKDQFSKGDEAAAEPDAETHEKMKKCLREL